MKKIVLFMLATVILFAQSGEAVARKAYAKISGYGSSISQTTMILKNTQGDENSRKIEMKKLEDTNGDKSLLIFLYPKDLKGTKLLSYEVIGGDDKQWLYLPAIKRVKRISARNKSGSFMGSEFSYEDIASQNYKNYLYPSEAKVVMKDDVECFKVIRVPKDKNSGYSKQIVFIDTKEYLVRYGKYFDKQDRLLKKIYFSDYILLNGVQRVHKIVIQNIQNKKQSMLIWDKDSILTGLSKRDFSKRILR